MSEFSFLDDPNEPTRLRRPRTPRSKPAIGPGLKLLLGFAGVICLFAIIIYALGPARKGQPDREDQAATAQPDRNAASDSPVLPTVHYSVYSEWNDDEDGHGKIIVIDPSNASAEKLKLLGNQIHREIGGETRAEVWVYDDAEALRLLSNPPTERTDDELEQLSRRAEAGDQGAKEELAKTRKRVEFIDEHLVGWYSRKSAKSWCAFTFYPHPHSSLNDLIESGGRTGCTRVKYTSSSQTFESNAPLPMRPPNNKWIKVDQTRISQQGGSGDNGKNIAVPTKETAKIEDKIVPESDPRSNSRSAKAHIDDGTVCLKKSDFQTALLNFTAAIALDPTEGAAWLGRGIAYASKGDFAKAIADYTRAIAVYSEVIGLDPNALAHVYMLRGIAYANRREDDRAIADFTEAIRLNPKDAGPYGNLAAVYVNKGENDKAIADYTEAIRLDPKSATAFSDRASLYSQMGEYSKAVVDYNETIRLSPKDVKAYENRASMHYKMGDYSGAVADCTEAIRLNAEDAGAYSNRGAAYAKMGESDKAIADCNEAIRRDPKLAAAYNWRGVAYDSKGEYENAIADYTAAIRLNPKYAAAYNKRGVAYEKSGEAAKAQNDFERARNLGYKAPTQTTETQYRTWTDSSGLHKIEAQFKGVVAEQVKLLKKDGTQLTLPLDKLSDEDQEWIRKRE